MSPRLMVLAAAAMVPLIAPLPAQDVYPSRPIGLGVSAPQPGD
jgi:hypothetical protein